ncbi:MULTISPECIES: hypothetical protein [unclassified Lysobacter]
MAKPNYSFEKRQREIAKKKKKEEKLSRKQPTKTDTTDTTDTSGDAAVTPTSHTPVQG